MRIKWKSTCKIKQEKESDKHLLKVIVFKVKNKFGIRTKLD